MLCYVSDQRSDKPDKKDNMTFICKLLVSYANIIALNAMKQSLQSLHTAGSQSQNMQLLHTTLIICNYCAFTMAWSLAG